MPTRDITVLRGAKAIAKAWGVTDKAFQKAATRRNRALADPRVPDHIREGFARRLPKDSHGEYKVTVARAMSYYREHVNPPRDDFPPQARKSGKFSTK